jgi:hypothetical protein
MAGEVSEAVRAYRQALEGIGCRWHDGLGPGLPAQEVRGRLRAIGLTAPDDLVEWFGLHDRFLPGISAHTQRYARAWDFPSIEWCLTKWSTFNDVAADVIDDESDGPLVVQPGEPEPWWRAWHRTLVPFITSASRPALVVECDPTLPPHAFYVNTSHDSLVKVGDSIADVVRVWTAAIESGRTRFDADGFLIDRMRGRPIIENLLL